MTYYKVDWMNVGPAGQTTEHTDYANGKREDIVLTYNTPFRTLTCIQEIMIKEIAPVDPKKYIQELVEVYK